MSHTSKHIRKELEKVAHLLIRKSSMYDDIEMYNQAVEIIGQEEVTRYKMNNNLELWKSDFDSFFERIERLERMLSK